MAHTRSKWQALLALTLLVPAPSIGVALAMFIEGTRGTSLGIAAYGASKIWILVLPAIWLFAVDRQKASASPLRRGGLTTGAALGVLIAIAIAAGYFAFAGWIDTETMREAAHRNGIGTPANYLALAAFLTVINSLLEEFVWRWFVFRKCEVLVGGIPAVLLSALFFTAHHFLALLAQTDAKVAALGAAGVFIGGAAWSWCYLRFRSVWPGYLSHIIADVGVFTVGWLVLFGDVAPPTLAPGNQSEWSGVTSISPAPH